LVGSYAWFSLCECLWACFYPLSAWHPTARHWLHLISSTLLCVSSRETTEKGEGKRGRERERLGGEREREREKEIERWVEIEREREKGGRESGGNVCVYIWTCLSVCVCVCVYIWTRRSVCVRVCVCMCVSCAVCYFS